MPLSVARVFQGFDTEEWPLGDSSSCSYSSSRSWAATAGRGNIMMSLQRAIWKWGKAVHTGAAGLEHKKGPGLGERYVLIIRKPGAND